MEHAYAWFRDALEHAQQHRDPVKNKRFVLIIMRMVVESQLNAGIVGQNPPPQIANRFEGENVANRIEGQNVGQHLVSSVTVNNLQRSKYFNETLYLLYPWVQVRLPELENLTENTNMHDLFDQSRGIWVLKHQRITVDNENANMHDLFDQSRGIWVLKHQRITVDNENVNENPVTTFEFTHVNENPVTTFALGEDIIIRYILSLRQPENREIRYSSQIIWNSRFSWRQILHHLEGNTYHFNFEPELMVIATNYFGNGSPAQVVERLPDVIIGQHDVMMCSVCQEKFKSGEPVKRLRCNHVYHAVCILQWFRRRLSCPTCRREPHASHRR